MKSLLCRKENNSLDVIPNETSFNIQIHQLKKCLQINRTTFDRIQSNLLSINQDQSNLFNQISHINTHAFHLHRHLHSLENQSQILEQQIFITQKNIDQIKHSIDWNQRKFQRLTIEKQQIVRCVLEKQHWIIRMNEHIQSNEKHLEQCQWNDNQLIEKVHRIRQELLRELHLLNSFKRREQIDYKHMIFSLKKQLLQTRKKKIHFQQQQILTKIKLNKSIRTRKK